jgi:hypothetical protein
MDTTLKEYYGGIFLLLGAVVFSFYIKKEMEKGNLGSPKKF